MLKFVRSAIGGACLLSTTVALAQYPTADKAATSAPKPAPATSVAPSGAKGFEKGVSEYNISKDIYITGDPLLLSKANMNAGKRITFVACPIYQESDPTPLWLAEYGGETYFLRAQQNLTGDVHHPQLMHRVLVEGVISNEPRIGRAIVLSPLNLSILPEFDIACNETRPSDGSRVAFAKRPPGPGSDGSHRETINEAYRTSRAKLDAVNYQADPVERVQRDFIVPFDFADEMVWNYAVAVSAVKFARDVDAKHITIHASRGSVRTSDGATLVEEADLPRRRAMGVRRIITDYPISPDKVTTTWDEKPVDADGVTDFANRYVKITVTPGDPVSH